MSAPRRPSGAAGGRPTGARRPGPPPPRRAARPLPRRVYWVRRLAALVVVGALVLAVAGLVRLLDPSADGVTARATTSAAGTGAGGTAADGGTAGRAASATTPAERAQRASKRQAAATRGTGSAAKPAQPDGPCDPADVVVSPSVGSAHRFARVRIRLEVTTRRTAACTFDVEPDAVFLTVTRPQRGGETETGVWSSQECPEAIPTVQVVARRDKPGVVPLWWDGKESASGCPADASWARVGVYRAHAVARGAATPVDVAFVLEPPRVAGEATAP